MKFVASLLLSLLVSCQAGTFTQIDGELRGHIKASDQWVVAVGAASLDVQTYLPQGFTVTFPLDVNEGTWFALEIASGQHWTGDLLDPLPPGAATMYTPEEWERVILGELARLP